MQSDYSAFQFKMAPDTIYYLLNVQVTIYPNWHQATITQVASGDADDGTIQHFRVWEGCIWYKIAPSGFEDHEFTLQKILCSFLRSLTKKRITFKKRSKAAQEQHLRVEIHVRLFPVTLRLLTPFLEALLPGTGLLIFAFQGAFTRQKRSFKSHSLALCLPASQVLRTFCQLIV